jgi:serine/threonine-protein kinase
MTAERVDARVGTDLGPYRIEAVIGRGGMGVVYLAEQTNLGRKVALKVLPSGLAEDADFRARFERESRMAAAIEHPNILPIYEAGEVDGVLFIAMRYVRGTDLETRLRAGPMAPAEAAPIIGQVAAALDAAHAAGLVHRDVKPANVLMATADDDGGDHAYLADFGLTKQRDSQTGLTRTGSFMGTLDYMAPEQIEAKPVDGRADQYALACVAYRCLTGDPPYARETDAAVLMAHVRDTPPSAHRARPELPDAIDAVLARALAKDPEARYPRCVGFATDLRHALAATTDPNRASGFAPGAEPPSGASAVAESPLEPTQATDRGRLIGTGAIVGAVVLAAGFFLVAGLGGSSPSTSSTLPLDAAGSSPHASSSPAESAAVSAPLSATESLSVFPNAAEESLLSLLPATLADDCDRGSYEPVAGGGRIEGSSFSGRKAPIASLACRPLVTTGANEVLVRQFSSGSGLVGSGAFTIGGAVSVIVFTHKVPPGDCSVSKRANGRFELSGEDQGAVVCYVDTATGDAILAWGFDTLGILIQATNQRGDSAALYDYFRKNARFIAP